MKILKNYKSTLMLLGGLILGGIAGLVFGEKAGIVAPIGDFFINLMYMLLVPLVFFSISSAIAQMEESSRLGKIMGSSMVVFSFTAFISAVLGYIGMLVFPILDTASFDVKTVIEQVGEITQPEAISIPDRVVSMLSVSDFSELLTRSNLLALILFAILVGISTAKSGEKGHAFKQLLLSGNDVIMVMVDYIMKLAPIGLGCYFAAVIGNFGQQLIGGYARVFILYCILSVIYFFGFFTLYAFMANGKEGVTTFWKNIGPPAITAIATSSSAACIPINLEYTRKMNVSKDIADTVIPLGANIHKDGSVIGGIFKIGFLFILYGRDITSLPNIIAIIAGGFFVGLVIGAIPGGGIIAETLIVSLFGFPVNSIPLMLIIGTIIDIPATLLNSAGNTVSAMMVQKMVGMFERKKAPTIDPVQPA